MTAINLAVQPGRRAAFLISDGATTDAEGRLVRVGGKTITFERFPAAIGVTGNVDYLAVGEECHAIGARNLATLVKALPTILKRACAKTLARCPGASEVLGILKVAGWSARQGRPVGYMIASDDIAAAFNIGPDWRAWQVAEVKSSHGTEDHVSTLLGRPCELEDAATFNPHEDAFALIEAQRQKPIASITPGAVPDRYRIGGEVELVEVSRRGVKVWGCGTFPDVVGEMIAPRSNSEAR